MPCEHDDEHRDAPVVAADLVTLRERLRELVRVARDTIDDSASQRAALEARRQRWRQRRIAEATARRDSSAPVGSNAADGACPHRPETADDSWGDLELRCKLAAAADEAARLADWYAGILEESADRGDAERRRAIARTEREVAAVERRNAHRLRSGVAASEIETPPSLPCW